MQAGVPLACAVVRPRQVPCCICQTRPDRLDVATALALVSSATHSVFGAIVCVSCSGSCQVLLLTWEVNCGSREQGWFVYRGCVHKCSETASFSPCRPAGPLAQSRTAAAAVQLVVSTGRPVACPCVLCSVINTQYAFQAELPQSWHKNEACEPSKSPPRPLRAPRPPCTSSSHRLEDSAGCAPHTACQGRRRRHRYRLHPLDPRPTALPPSVQVHHGRRAGAAVGLRPQRRHGGALQPDAAGPAGEAIESSGKLPLTRAPCSPSSLSTLFSSPPQLDAIYHTSIVVGGIEHYFGGRSLAACVLAGGLHTQVPRLRTAPAPLKSASSARPSLLSDPPCLLAGGINTAVPGTTPFGTPMQKLAIGHTQLPEDVRAELLAELSERYTPGAWVCGIACKQKCCRRRPERRMQRSFNEWVAAHACMRVHVHASSCSRQARRRPVHRPLCRPVSPAPNNQSPQRATACSRTTVMTSAMTWRSCS